MSTIARLLLVSSRLAAQNWVAIAARPAIDLQLELRAATAGWDLLSTQTNKERSPLRRELCLIGSRRVAVSKLASPRPGVEAARRRSVEAELHLTQT